MNSLFVFAAHNTIVALVLALFVYGFTRVWRNPPLAHLLWLLVLLKLVAPAVMHVDLSSLALRESVHARDQIIAEVSRFEGEKDPSHSRFEGQNDKSRTRFIDRPTAQTAAPASVAGVKERDLAAGLRLFWIRARPVVFWVWLGGAALCALLAATRIVRFEHLLRDTLPAPERLQRLTCEIAGKIGVSHVPDVRYVECADVPLLWCAGRCPTIVLPMRLMRQLDDRQVALILAHELAHLRRRDNWVRGIELIVSTLYWWNPLVWVIRRQLHQAEDLCCDAWVRWSYPDCTKSYAELVLKTAESLSASQVSTRLLPASPLFGSLSLKARLEMILESRFAPQASTRSLFATSLLGLLVLPAFVQIMTTQTLADSKDETPATPNANADAPATTEFPHVVRFEQGAAHFEDGDEITIVEVRGTSEAFSPGHTYQIKGSYTLASHDSAMLAAYTTAWDAADASGPTTKVQTTVVDRGKGTFTLILPMSCEGWPHVSFYAGGTSFGGNYFGTGDAVMKKWWGTKQTEQLATSTPKNEARTTHTGETDTPTTSEFPYAVRFEQGATRFADDDDITILEIRGTADTFKPGHIYWISGTYTLASHDRATLAAYTTAKHAADASGTSFKVQTTVVDQGKGAFTLILPMSCEGWPHVSFYPAGGGSGFGGNYFGTGDTVLKQWWGSK